MHASVSVNVVLCLTARHHLPPPFSPQHVTASDGSLTTLLYDGGESKLRAIVDKKLSLDVAVQGDTPGQWVEQATVGHRVVTFSPFSCVASNAVFVTVLNGTGYTTHVVRDAATQTSFPLRLALVESVVAGPGPACELLVVGAEMQRQSMALYSMECTSGALKHIVTYGTDVDSTGAAAVDADGRHWAVLVSANGKPALRVVDVAKGTIVRSQNLSAAPAALAWAPDNAST